VAHQLAHEGRRDFGPLEDDAVELYDLLVVGGGLSGLAAAWFYRREHPDARILILDNHDDFGGHARRNEFRSGGRTLIGYGGSQSLEEPDRYGASTKRLLRELGIETPRFHDHYDRHFFRRHGLGLGFFFDRETYGVDRLVRTDMANPLDDEYAPSPVSQLDAVQQMPISEAAQRALRRVISPAPELFRTAAGEWHVAFLQEITYLDYLRQRLGVDDPEVTGILNGAAVSAFADSIDNIAAWDAVTWGGLPGLPEELRKQVFSEAYVSAPYIFHFPDGNASVARLLVASLVPGVVGGEKLGMDTVVTARFDYSRLDEAGSAVRLRLESTAVRVEHHGSPASAKRVAVTYVRRGRARRVWGKACVMACNNVMIPHLCPELPAEQRQSLGDLVRAPLVYTSVLLREWQPWKRAGLGLALCPGTYHQVAMLDFPVSMGGYRFASGPDQPIIAHLEGSPLHPGSGLTRRQQYQAARAVMLNTPFESIERSIRLQLGGMLGAFGLDPARDIEGITVNRWAHGYAYGYQPLVDAEEFEGELPHVVGRRRFGRVTIACSDAGAWASIDSAITQAHRAVQELA
jgi:spermidine dehydrogenase